MSFKSYRVEETEVGVQAAWTEQTEDNLPDADVLVEVRYSSVNYKDALSASGNKGVTKAYPHTPGIDAAGVVLESSDSRFKAGDEVVIFGYDLGMNTPGGYGQKICVDADWVLKKPEKISLAETMAWGTAGFTAALSVQKLERSGVSPAKGKVLVTGATGGVGSVAVKLLSQLGYEVVAVSGKAEQENWLISLGASSVIDRSALLELKGKAMAKPLYQAALDTVGGDMISALIPQIKPEGAVSTCGMVAGIKFEASVFPFILRGVSLIGVDSVEIPPGDKQSLLNKVASEWWLDLENLTREVGRDELADVLVKVLKGQGVGRYRLNLNKE